VEGGQLALLWQAAPPQPQRQQGSKPSLMLSISSLCVLLKGFQKIKSCNTTQRSPSQKPAAAKLYNQPFPNAIILVTHRNQSPVRNQLYARFKIAITSRIS
jgi:hypothetical protein